MIEKRTNRLRKCLHGKSPVFLVAGLGEMMPKTPPKPHLTPNAHSSKSIPEGRLRYRKHISDLMGKDAELLSRHYELWLWLTGHVWY